MEIQSKSDSAGNKLLQPPEPGTFQNLANLSNYVCNFGVRQGYVVTIKNSKRNELVTLGCDRGGVSRNKLKPEERKRKRATSSRLTNCPFEAIGKKVDNVWVLSVNKGEHNHEAFRDMSEHRYSKRFTKEEVNNIMSMDKAGFKPSKIIEVLKQNNRKFNSTPRHLYNLKAKLRRGKLTGESCCNRSWRPRTSAISFMSGEPPSRYNCVLKVQNLVGGKFLNSEASEVVDVLNPATQEVVSQVPLTTHGEFEAAVRAAKEAFPSWKNTPFATRQRIVYKLQELIRRDMDKLATKIVIEQDKALSSAKDEVLLGVEAVGYACGMATMQMGELISDACNVTDVYCVREPIGVCAGICPYNFPATIALWMFPIAITYGNTFILKPSEINPGASMILAELAMEAGLPNGVLNVVHGTDDLVDQICDDDDIKAITLLGSDDAGMQRYGRAAARGKHVQTKLGGKNHAIIMPDACFDATLDALLAACFGAAGQRCMTLSVVIFVGSSNTWEDELVARAKKLKVNSGKEPGTEVGPVICKEERNKICRLVQSGVESGAKVILDGRNILVPKYELGNFVGPTILSDITTDMDCYKEEMFGPVLLCMQVENLEQAVAIANKQKYGSGVSIFTTSPVIAKKFQSEVNIGLIGVNVPVPIPMSSSSFDRPSTSLSCEFYFCNKESVEFYTVKKTIAQQWGDGPTRTLSAPLPPVLETETGAQGLTPIPEIEIGTQALPPASETEAVTPALPLILDAETSCNELESSPASPLPFEMEMDTPNQNLSQSSSPLSEGGGLPNRRPFSFTAVRESTICDGSPDIPSIPRMASVNQETSLTMPFASENGLPVQEAVNSGESTLTLSRAEIQLFPPTSMPQAAQKTGKMELNHGSGSSMPPKRRRNNKIVGSVKQRIMAQKFKSADIDVKQSSESSISHTASQRTGNPFENSSSEQMFIWTAQGNGKKIVKAVANTQRDYIPASYRNKFFPWKKIEPEPSTADRS